MSWPLWLTPTWLPQTSAVVKNDQPLKPR